MDIVIIFGVIWLICGFICSSIASGKGHGGCGWFVLGVLFGPLAILFAIVQSPADPNAANVAADGHEHLWEEISIPDQRAQNRTHEGQRCSVCGFSRLKPHEHAWGEPYVNPYRHQMLQSCDGCRKKRVVT